MASLDPKSLVEIASSSTNPLFAVKTLVLASEIYLSKLCTQSKEYSQKIKSILAQAECLKQWDYDISRNEEIILLKGSVLSCCKVPPWNGNPAPEMYIVPLQLSTYVRVDRIPLSPGQLNRIDRWVDGREIYGSRMWPDKLDLQQDILPNCSFVASLLALSFSTNFNISSIILSHGSSFVFKFYLNGTYRRLGITPNIPLSFSSTPLTVTSSYLGPILVEKGYHALRNTYDFKGSNSATDLFLLLGYIPEIISLHSSDVCLDEIRQRGGVMTVGSSKYQVIGRHSFALAEVDQKTVRVINPWGGSKLHEWTQLYRSFSVLYISHDPLQFRYRYQKHFSGSQQFLVGSSHSDICVLLSQHISSWTETWTAIDVFLGPARVYDFRNPILKGHKQDSFYTFCRLKSSSIPRVLVPASPHPSNWTIALYSEEPFVCEPIVSSAFHFTATGLWGQVSKITSSTLITSQQYRITVSSTSWVAIVLLSPKGLVRLDLLSSNDRIDRLRAGDCLINSGNYQASPTVISKVLNPGTFIVIPTCFEPTDGGYEIHVESDADINLEKLPSYDAGKFKRTLSTKCPQIQFTSLRLTEISIIVFSKEFLGLQLVNGSEEIIWEEHMSDGRRGLFSGKRRLERGLYYLIRIGEGEWKLEVISDNKIEIY